MKAIIEISECDFEYIKNYSDASLDMYERLREGVKNGTALPRDSMIIDRDKLEKDSAYDAYYDGYCAYSDIALEAAQIEL